MDAITQHLRQRIESGQWLPGQRLATEKELALELGVSPATVQRSMGLLQEAGLIRARRGSGRFVSEQAPLRRTREIMVIIAYPTHMFFPAMVSIGRGIASVVEEKGYHLKYWAIHSAASESDDQSAWNNLLRTGRTEGLIVATQQIPRDWLEAAAEKIPVVWMHPIAKPPRLSSVAIDYLGGAFLAGRHLVERGHRHITLLTTRIGDFIAQSQIDGLRLAMFDALRDGTGRLDLLRCSVQSSVENGRLLGRQWLDTPADQRTTAVIGGSDELILGFYEVLNEAKIRIPADLSLVGWNDMLTQEQIPIPLTSVRVHFEEGGRRSARQLIEMIEKPAHFPEPQRVEADLVVRDSTRSLY
jgi:DNA-binding LacI/PurR family transcriptional regulator